MSALPRAEMAVVDLSTVKTCSCGREFDRYSWSMLPLCGHVPGEDVSSVLEMRHCRCGSTIALEIPRAQVVSLKERP